MISKDDSSIGFEFQSLRYIQLNSKDRKTCIIIKMDSASLVKFNHAMQELMDTPKAREVLEKYGIKRVSKKEGE